MDRNPPGAKADRTQSCLEARSATHVDRTQSPKILPPKNLTSLRIQLNPFAGWQNLGSGNRERTRSLPVNSLLNACEALPRGPSGNKVLASRRSISPFLSFWFRRCADRPSSQTGVLQDKQAKGACLFKIEFPQNAPWHGRVVSKVL